MLLMPGVEVTGKFILDKECSEPVLPAIYIVTPPSHIPSHPHILMVTNHSWLIGKLLVYIACIM